MDLQQGRYGMVCMTDLVFAETLNYLVAKARDHTLAERIASELLGESSKPWVRLVWLDPAVWAAARVRFRRLSSDGLSFTDCTSIATVETLRLDGIMGFDTGFDGLVPRFS